MPKAKKIAEPDMPEVVQQLSFFDVRVFFYKKNPFTGGKMLVYNVHSNHHETPMAAMKAYVESTEAAHGYGNIVSIECFAYRYDEGTDKSSAKMGERQWRIVID